MQLLYGHRTAIRKAYLCTLMIQEKAKSFYSNFKQKKGKESKAGELNASKEWFENFRKRFGLKIVKIIEKQLTLTKTQEIVLR